MSASAKSATSGAAAAFTGAPSADLICVTRSPRAWSRLCTWPSSCALSWSNSECNFATRCFAESYLRFDISSLHTHAHTHTLASPPAAPQSTTEPIPPQHRCSRNMQDPRHGPRNPPSGSFALHLTHTNTTFGIRQHWASTCSAQAKLPGNTPSHIKSSRHRVLRHPKRWHSSPNPPTVPDSIF